METAYAQALWKIVKGDLPAGRQGMTPHKAVEALREVLVKDGREILLSRISKAFEKIATRELARTQLTLSVAREKDERHAKREVKKVLEKLHLNEKHLVTRIDPHLIGGWRLEGAEHLVDASFKKHLLSIYNRATAE